MKLDKIRKLLALLLVFAIGLSIVGCARVQAEDQTKDILPQTVSEKAPDQKFITSQMAFSVNLLQQTIRQERNVNQLISPASVQLALAMTANGAVGQTREEMETVLGGIPLEELNEYLLGYIGNLPSQEEYKLQIANSIWFRDDENRLQVEQAFLQKNADYYNSQIYRAAFDSKTLEDINRWVKERTDGMIDSILTEIEDDAVLYLINALTFDAKWQRVYGSQDVSKGMFTNIHGKTEQVDMMHSEESLYLSDEMATGFIKNYKDCKYSFAALLPNEGVDLYAYIDGLTGEALLELLNSAQTGSVMATLPKFSYAYELSMNDVLKTLGMPAAFDSELADFSAMAHSSRGNIFIGDVLHKTFISVDALGTKAGAVTKVEMNDECALLSNWVVNLNRPFLYMIIDNETDLPIFMGTVTEI